MQTANQTTQKKIDKLISLQDISCFLSLFETVTLL